MTTLLMIVLDLNSVDSDLPYSIVSSVFTFVAAKSTTTAVGDCCEELRGI
jgi:hypothetical protein